MNFNAEQWKFIKTRKRRQINKATQFLYFETTLAILITYYFDFTSPPSTKRKIKEISGWFYMNYIT